MVTGGHGIRRASGFTYIGLLVLVALMATGLAGAGQMWGNEARREQERELLFAGNQFRNAIRDYYEGSPEPRRFPQSLEDLVEDRRLPVVRRYLRRVYADPILRTQAWGVVRGPGNGIVGIYSRSAQPPLKTENFRPDDAHFAGAKAYSDWKFVYAPESAAHPAAGEAMK